MSFFVLRPAFSLALILAMLAGAHAQEWHVWGEELQPIFEVLREDKSSAFLELRGGCDLSHLPDIPNFGNPTSPRAPSLQKLREIVANNPGVRVTRESNGRYLLKERGIPTDVLKVKLKHFVFEDYGHNDISSASFALTMILSSPEVTAYMKAHRVLWRRPGGFIGGLGPSVRVPGLPYLSGSLDNATVSQAIDRVFEVFRGEVLVYWDCPFKRPKPRRAMPGLEARQIASAYPSNCSALDDQANVGLDFRPSQLPNPLCLPPRAFSKTPLSLTVNEAPPDRTKWKREVFFQFFLAKQFRGRTRVFNG